MAWGEAGFHENSILDKASPNTDRKLDNLDPLAQPPQCGSKKLYKDGLRYLTDGTTVQRWLCHKCSYRFTEKKALQKKPNWQINSGSVSLSERQVCELLTAESRNLTEVARQETASQEGTETRQITERLVDYAWQAKKRGLAEQTIRQRVHKLRLLTKRGANITNPETVLDVLATSNWTQANKRTIIIAYQSFAKTYGLQWQPPKTRVERKIPFIPTEQEISQLIAGCGKRTATLLQTLKDTAARTR